MLSKKAGPYVVSTLKLKNERDIWAYQNLGKITK